MAFSRPPESATRVKVLRLTAVGATVANVALAALSIASQRSADTSQRRRCKISSKLSSCHAQATYIGHIKI